MLQLDLASIAASQKAAQEVMSWEDVPQINILMNNAGIMTGPYYKTVDDWKVNSEPTISGISYLLKGVMSKVLAAVRDRFKLKIINISSRGHRFGMIRWDDLDFTARAHHLSNAC